jgi:small-conductance mechanosensitive channel
LITVIQELGFQSLLETGGVLGFIGVMLALTQGAWAPDVISGLIILNSDLFEEGDVIELENGHKTLGTIFKTKIFHTEILNLVNNHRIMIKNALLREHTVHNLSKFASARGLRECLSFKIGYDVSTAQVKALFEKSYADMLSESIPLAEQHGYEVKLLDTGDHALEWGFIYYVKEVEKLVAIRRDAREAILQASIEVGVSLATPLTYTKAALEV